MKELLENVDEFIEAGEESLIKKRYNVSASDFFKAIVICCDYLIYNQIKRLPKNHNDRFNLLKLYFKDIYEKVNFLFGIYIKSYNLKMELKEVLLLKKYVYEIRKIISD